MPAMEWDEPGMKRNKNVRFRMGQGSNTVSYYPPQSALDVGRNPSVYNPSNVPALRPSSAMAIRQSMVPARLGETVLDRNFNLGNATEVSSPTKPFKPTNLPIVRPSALPSVVPPQTGFQMGTGGPVEVSSVARPATPQLQIGYDGPKERISLGQVRQNLNKGKFVGPPAPEGYAAPQSQTALPNEGFVGPKNMGAFTPRTIFGGSHVIDPSGSLAGELYRRLSKSTGRYIPGLEQMWGGQPNADEWKQGADDAYQQARSGLKVHPMNTQYKNHGMSATGFPSITAEQRDAIVGRQDVPQQEEKAQDIVYGKTPGSAYIYGGKDFMVKGSGPATGGFSRPKDADKYAQEEQNRANNFWADAAKQRALETTDKQNSMMTQLNSAIRSGNQEQAAMFTNAIKGVGAIQPLNYGATENQLAEARTRQAALPYIGPKAEAETGLQNAQAGYYQGKNATERGNAMYQGYVKTLLEKMKGSGTKALSATDWKALSDLQMTNPEMYAQAMADLKRQG